MAKSQKRKNKNPRREQHPRKTPNKQSKKPIPEFDEPFTKTSDYLLEEKEKDQGVIRRFLLNRRLQSFFIFIVAIILYANTIPHEYAVDDAIVITRNDFTKRGLDGMGDIWKHDAFVGYFGKDVNLVAGGRYRPFSIATFALEMELFGEELKDPRTRKALEDEEGYVIHEGNPHISHFINILLYGLLCWFLYWLFIELFDPGSKDKDNIKAAFIAFVGALLYATHPIHTEAVANIKGRDEILVLMGSIMALYWSVRAVNIPKQMVRYLIFASLGFLMGIFSKENAITFIAIIPVALHIFTKAKFEKIGMITGIFVLWTALFWFGIRGLVYSGTKANTDPVPQELMNDPFLKIVDKDGVYKYEEYTTNERLGTILYTWTDYLRLLVLPYELTNDYYPKEVRMSTGEEVIPTLTHPYSILGLLLYGLLGTLGIWGIIKRNPLAFCIVFYAATFSVISNLFFTIGSNMAERFLFLPSVGFSLACALGAYAFTNRKLSKEEREVSVRDVLPVQKSRYQIAFLLVSLVVCVYSIRTVTRNPAWENDYVLFTTDIEVSKNSAKLNNAVAGVLQEKITSKLSTNERLKIAQRAYDHAQKAIDLHPLYNQAWLLKGNAMVHMANAQEERGTSLLGSDRANAEKDLKAALDNFNAAIESYNRVLALRPDHPDAKGNMGVAYRDRGKLLGQKFNEMNASVESLQKALEYNPRDKDAHRLLGVASGIMGKPLEAIDHFKRSMEIGGESAALHYNLKIGYENMASVARNTGDVAKMEEYSSEAQKHHNRCYEIEPNYDPTK